MRNFVSISTNEDPKYLFYWPITCFAWRSFGWEPIIFYVGHANKFTELIYKSYDKLMSDCTCEMRMLYKYKVYNIKKVGDYNESTIAQVSRMYACALPFVEANDIILLSDMDMLPLSDYWIKDNNINCYGRNLSDEHQPMCYVSAPAKTWHHVIMSLCNKNIEEMICRDLDRMVPKAKRIWSVDQDILTDNLDSLHITRIDRPINSKTHYPVGRVDRSAWTLLHDQFIDCHAYHDVLNAEHRFQDLMMLMHKIWPTHDLKWIPEYYKEFKKLL